MNVADICIIKRDGKRENFSASKISNAIGKAFQATGLENQERLIDEITQRVIAHFEHPTLGVEEIQDLVENELMKVQPEVAKKYIIYRQWRNTERERKTQMKHIMDGIVAIDKNDVNLSNANMSSHTPAGQMMTFASEVTKDYTYIINTSCPSNMPKRTAWGISISMTWTTIRPRQRHASNMTWTIYSNGVSIQRTEASARLSLSKAMLHWLLLFSKPIKTSNTEGRLSPHSTFSWQKAY